MWKRSQKPLVVRELVERMLRRGSEQSKELLKNVISKYKWIHKLTSCCLQCQK